MCSTLTAWLTGWLQASCRGRDECDWRMYDVVAVMRQQRELKVQASLARPAKLSHHFAPS